LGHIGATTDVQNGRTVTESGGIDDMVRSETLAGTAGSTERHLPFASLALIAAAGIGLAAWLPDAKGLGIFLPLTALLAGLAVERSGGFRRTPAGIAYGLVALALVATTAVRDAAWFLVPNMLFALVFAALAVAQPATWTEALTGLLTPASRLPYSPASLVRSTSAAAGSRNPARTAGLIRGLVVGGVLVAVFWALFASADRVFARITRNLLPNWDFGMLPARAVIFLFVALVTGAFVLAAVRGAPTWLGGMVSQLDKARFRLGRVEWMAMLGLLNVLFLAFAAVQLVVLFQGHEHVLRTAGLTYAEYAREGFFQLLAATALTVAVVCFAWTRSRRESRADHIVMKALLGLLCALTLVIVASALRRLGLYEDAFGFTRDRLAAHAVALWLGGVVLAMLVAGAVGRTRWLFPAVTALTALAFLGFTAVNPDGAIARRNLERYAQTGKIDQDYLTHLSADAIPVLVEHKDPVAGWVLQNYQNPLPDSEPWSSANLSRINARHVVAQNGVQMPQP
jgi:hypothetical protein